MPIGVKFLLYISAKPEHLTIQYRNGSLLRLNAIAETVVPGELNYPDSKFEALGLVDIQESSSI